MSSIENLSLLESDRTGNTNPLSIAAKTVVGVLAHSGYNPSYENCQRNIIENLKTGDADTFLPTPLKQVLEMDKHLPQDDKTVTFADQTFVKVNHSSNGITTLRHLCPHPKVLGDPAYTIKNFFIVDSVSGKAWDISQLWKDLPVSENDGQTKPITMLTIPKLPNAGYAMTKDGPTLILNRLSEQPKNTSLYKEVGKEGLELTDHFIPMHESAHMIMFNRDRSNDDLDTKLLKSYLQSLKNIIMRPFYSLLEKFRFRPVNPITKALKFYTVHKERNAHAFALGVARKLKTLGVDLLRNIPNSTVYKVVDYFLRSYDKNNRAINLPGLAYTQELRRKLRLKKLHKHPALSPA